MARKKNDESPELEDSKISSVSSIKDDLVSLISKNINKEFKDADQVVWFLDEPEEAPTQVTYWVPTGNDILDIAISNRPYGGVPGGKLTILAGLESSGKSLLAAHILAETQKMGGIAVYIDTESSANNQFLQSIGVDLKNLVYIQLGLIEDCFQAIENIVTSVRNSSKDRPVTIVLDSIAGASDKVEMESEYDKDGYNTAKSIIMSKSLRKITNLIAKQKIAIVFTNQLRMKMQTMAFSDPYIMPSGKAAPFHASVITRLSSLAKIKKGDVVVGNKIKAMVTKNKVGPPFRSVEFEIYYDSGIDNYGSWITTMKEHGIVKQSGSQYTVEVPNFSEPDKENEVIKFMAKEFKDLVEARPNVKKYLYDKICDALIMKYRKLGEIRIDEDNQLDNSITED